MPMKNVRDTAASLGLLALRVGTGAFLLYGHGWGKLMHFAERAPKFSDPIGLGPTASFTLVVFAEVFCAAGLVLGVATRLAAIPIVIFSLVAAFVANAGAPFGDKELALLYLVPALTLVLTGPGRFSVDALITRGRG